MAFQLPFGANSGDSGTVSPSDVARRRLLAQQLLSSGGIQNAGPLGAIANTLSGSLSGYENKQASDMEGKGQEQARALMSQVLSSDNPTMATLGEAASNPWLNSGQSGLVNALLGKTMDQNDPMKQLALKQAQLNYDQDASGVGADASAPSNVQEWEYYSKLSPEAQAQYLTMKRSNSPLNIGTGFVTQNPANPGEVLGSQIPIDSQTPAFDTATGTGLGKANAENIAAYDSMASKLPGLRSVVADLSELAKTATYTQTGQLIDAATRELGGQMSPAAVARAQYIAAIDSQVLPLLRETFGAAFTEREGQSLKATLGNPDASPVEKQAILEAFIAQKERDVQAMGSRIPGADQPGGNEGWTDLGEGIRIRPMGQ